MEIKKTTVKAKPRKLNARWTVETQKEVRIQHGMPWPTREITKPQRKKGFTRSIWRAVYDELFYRWQMKQWNKAGDDVESEIAAALSQEITKEIDNEILAEIQKTMQVPNKLLGNKR